MKKVMEASELDWPPGHFPKEFELDKIKYHQDFANYRKDGELESVVYIDPNFNTITVLND